MVNLLVGWGCFSFVPDANWDNLLENRFSGETLKLLNMYPYYTKNRQSLRVFPKNPFPWKLWSEWTEKAMCDYAGAVHVITIICHGARHYK